MGCSASKNVLDQTQPHHHVQYVSSKISGGSSVYAKLGRSASTTSLSLRHHQHRRGDNNNSNNTNSNVKTPGVVDNTNSCCSSYHVVILTSSSYGLLTMDHHQQQQSLQQHQQQQSLLHHHQHQRLAEKQVENGGGILQVPSTASCQASATDLVTGERMSSADENYLVKNFDIVPAVDLVKMTMMKKKKKKNPKVLLVSEVDEEVEMPAESVNLSELMDGLEEGGGGEEEDMSEWSAAAADFSDQELGISPPVESSPAEEALLQMVVECEEKKPSDHRHDQGTNPLTAAPAPAAGGGSTKLKPSPASTSPGADARQAAASKATAASVRPGLSKPPRYPVKLQPPKLVPAESDSTTAAAKASESSSIGKELETNRQSSATREDHFWTEELECTIHESDSLLEAFERELEQFLNNSKEEEKEEWYCKVGNKSEDGEENSEAAKYHSDQALLLQLPGAVDTTTTTTTTKRNKIIQDCGAGKKLQQEGATVVMKPEQPASWEEEDFFWQEADEQKLAPLYTSSTAITSGTIAQGITKIFQDCTHVKFILQRMGISIDELATLVEEEEAGSLPSQNSPREASSL